MKFKHSIIAFSIVVVMFFSIGKLDAQPWLSPVKICTGTDGVNFSSSSMFQDSSGVPTVINLGGDTLLAAFQWFPMPFQNAAHWDKVAVKFSYDGGTTWTIPTTCVFNNSPVGFQRPFDPALYRTSTGQIRMYFSCGPFNPPPGAINTYSALSTDGINYTFDSLARYDDATRDAIDPSVDYFNGSYYYIAHTMVNSDGAYFATSPDGLNFSPQPMISYDGVHAWLGNFLQDGAFNRFYGTGNGIWMNATTDMVTWSGFQSTNVMGADPAVVKNSSGTYVMLYTGPPNMSGIANSAFNEKNISIYPNPAHDFFTVRFTGKDFSPANNYTIRICSVDGKIILVKNLSTPLVEIETEGIPPGMYFYSIFENDETVKNGKLAVIK